MSTIYNRVYLDEENWKAEEIAAERGDPYLFIYDEKPETFENLPPNLTDQPRLIFLSKNHKKIAKIYLQT